MSKDYNALNAIVIEGNGTIEYVNCNYMKKFGMMPKVM